jgi:uncharacterized membrane protein YgcG
MGVQRLVVQLVSFFALMIALSASSSAEERITNFVSEAKIQLDGSLEVVETITVIAEGGEIKRGILRDFPTRYKDRHGLRVNVGFEVLSVWRDGREEPYAVESIGNGKRIRIGDKDVFLDSGPHTYRIAYRTTRQLGFFERYDELYWNVTGNAWTFAIEQVEAIISLPPGARIIQHAAYTGPQGANGQDFRVTQGEGTTYRAVTTRRLAPGEGFTVAIGFTKGLVPEPTGADRLRDTVSDNLGIAALIAAVLAVFGYYYWAWSRVGRDPPQGTIIPLFSPPEGLGPAGVRYVWRQKFDDKTFAASVVGLAVNGRARIHDDDGDFAIERLGNQGPPLAASETALYGALASGTLKLKKSNHRRVAAAREALESSLKKLFDGTAFVRNRKWFWRGLGLSVALLVIGALFLPAEDAALGLFMSVWAGIWWGVILVFISKAVRGLWQPGVGSKVGSVFMLLFMIPFVTGGVLAPTAMIFGSESLGLAVLAGAAVLMGLMNAVFFRLLSAPTLEGRKLMDRIEGFRMYMTTAEEDRLNSLTPPEKTPALFEKYLPYALALDCENEWNDKFAAVLAAAGVAAAAPAWYSGTHWDSRNLGGFTNSIGSSLAASTASSSSPPGSSSGSSGGGSSGGGGGGGGGSGW